MSGPGKSSPWRVLASVAGVMVFCGLVYVVVSMVLSDKGAPRKPPEIKIVAIMPPPPPPPPPPPEPPKMVEQTPIQEQPKEMMKEEAKKEDEPPPGPLSLDAKGEGPGDLFNLGGKPGGRGLFGGGGGSKFGSYASMVQMQIEAALRQHPKTKNATLNVPMARLWSDASGRIDRVQLASSTGDAELDAALREVLGGLVLREPPPKDMPMPINIRITERRAG